MAKQQNIDYSVKTADCETNFYKRRQRIRNFERSNLMKLIRKQNVTIAFWPQKIKRRRNQMKMVEAFQSFMEATEEDWDMEVCTKAEVESEQI